MVETVNEHPNQEDFPLDYPPHLRYESYSLEELELMIESEWAKFEKGIVPDNIYGRPLDQVV